MPSEVWKLKWTPVCETKHHFFTPNTLAGFIYFTYTTHKLIHIFKCLDLTWLAYPNRLWRRGRGVTGNLFLYLEFFLHRLPIVHSNMGVAHVCMVLYGGNKINARQTCALCFLHPLPFIKSYVKVAKTHNDIWFCSHRVTNVHQSYLAFTIQIEKENSS